MTAQKKDMTLPTPHGIFNYRIAFLLFYKNKVLIHCDPTKRDFWYTPGGRVQFGEDSITALKREVLEETNISEDLGFKFAGTIENFFNMDGHNYHELMFVYTAELDKEITLPEVDELGKPLPHKWVSAEEIKETNIYPSLFKERIFEFREGFRQIIHKDKTH